MTTTALPRAASRPAVIARWWPKLREKDRALYRESADPNSQRRELVREKNDASAAHRERMAARRAFGADARDEPTLATRRRSRRDDARDELTSQRAGAFIAREFTLPKQLR